MPERLDPVNWSLDKPRGFPRDLCSLEHYPAGLKPAVLAGLTAGGRTLSSLAETDWTELAFPQSFWEAVALETDRFASYRVCNSIPYWCYRNLHCKVDSGRLGQVSLAKLGPDGCSVDLLKKYFAARLWAGMYKCLGGMSALFDTDSQWGSSFMRSCVTKDQFSLLSAALHFVDNERQEELQVDDRDVAWHFQPVIDELVDHLLSIYNPTTSTCFDETMIKCLSQMMPRNIRMTIEGKPIPMGLEQFNLCDANFVSIWRKFFLSGLPDVKNQAVLEAAQKCKLKGHVLTLDQGYASLELVCHLSDMGVHVVMMLKRPAANEGALGVIDPLRALVQSMEGQPRGTIKHIYYRSKVLIVAWMDKSLVLMATTVFAHDSPAMSVRVVELVS